MTEQTVRVRAKISSWVGVGGRELLLHAGAELDVPADEAAAHPDWWDVVSAAVTLDNSSATDAPAAGVDAGDTTVEAAPEEPADPKPAKATRGRRRGA
jgi:hypothetical protein